MSFTKTKHVDNNHDILWANNADRNVVDFSAEHTSCGPNTFKDVSLSMDLSKRGPGGLHVTFTKAVSTWYDVFTMSNTSGTKFDLMAIPHTSEDDFELPLGYDYAHIRGAILTNAAGDIYRFKQYNGWWMWNEATNVAPLRVINGIAGVGAVWTLQSLAGIICPHATQYYAGVYMTSGAGGATYYSVRPYGSNIVPDPVSAAVLYSARGLGQFCGNRIVDRCDSLQRIEHRDVNCQIKYMDILGYYDPHG